MSLDNDDATLEGAVRGPRVQVLLSSYNGAKFIDAQLQSLMRQNVLPYSVLVRDDRSTDGTLGILDIWEKREKSLTVYRGATNLGVVKSFLELLKRADDSAEYIALCDQDDVWLPQKIERAIHSIEGLPSRKAKGAEAPVLYFSRLQYVDESLLPLGQSPIPEFISLESALVENVATGCSVVITQKLRQVLLEALPENDCLMHDWWLYLLAHSFGEVVYDSTPSVLYRQHAGNVVGASASFFEIYKRKISRFFARKQGATHVGDQALEFLKCYGEKMSPAKAGKIHGLTMARGSFLLRFWLAMKLPYKRQSRIDTFILRVLIVLNRF